MNAETPLMAERLAEIRAGRTEYRTTAQLDADIADLLAEVERLQRTYTFDVAELRRQIADLSDQLAGARRTVDEQQDEIQQLRGQLLQATGGTGAVVERLRQQQERIGGLEAELAARPSRADVLRAEANWLEEIATPIRGERSEHERGQMYAARRLRERAAEADDAGKVTATGGITRAEVLNDAADRIAARAAQMDAVWLRADQVCDALRRLGTEPAPSTAGGDR